MPSIAIPGWIQIVIHATSEGSDRVNVVNYETANLSPSSEDLEELALQFATSILPAYTGLANAGVVFEEFIATYRGVEPFVQGIYAPSGGNVGTQAGDPVPANVAGSVQWKTGLVGKKYRGRTSVFGFTEAQTSGSIFNSVGLLDLNDLAVLLFAFDGTDDVPAQLVVASQVGEFLTPVVAYIIDAFTDSMRSRLIGRGN